MMLNQVSQIDLKTAFNLEYSVINFKDVNTKNCQKFKKFSDKLGKDSKLSIYNNYNAKTMPESKAKNDTYYNKDLIEFDSNSPS